MTVDTETILDSLIERVAKLEKLAIVFVDFMKANGESIENMTVNLQAINVLCAEAGTYTPADYARAQVRVRAMLDQHRATCDDRDRDTADADGAGDHGGT